MTCPYLHVLGGLGKGCRVESDLKLVIGIVIKVRKGS